MADQTVVAQETVHSNPDAKTRILKMEMRGFKSFATKTELPFGEKYNCIIGPNGSGKSNVLDSLCFVLGKTSAKSMRAEKSANLIYNGGKTKNPAKEAEVAIIFDNKTRAFPKDGDEVRVSRIVRPNGASIYKINGETVTRQQTLELLLGARIDPDGYNIILQGDIIGLIEMSPENRRMIIEEISGIGEYEDKRHRAELDLAKVDQQLKDSEIILAERGTYLKELKKERDQAQKFKDLEEKLKRNKATILWRKRTEREDKESKLQKQLDEEQKKADAVQAKINELKTQVAANKERAKAISDEIQHKGQKDQIELNKIVEQLRVDIGVNGNRIDTLKTELTRIEERKKQLQTQQTEIKKRLTDISAENSEATTRDASLTKALTDLQHKITAFRKQHNLEDAAAVDDDIAAIDKEIERTQEESAKLRSEEQQLLREKDKIEYRLRDIDEKITKTLEQESKNKGQVSELKTDKESLAKAERDLKRSLESAKLLHSEHQQAQEKLRTTQHELSKLRSRQIQISEASSANLATTKILENKSIKGVHGTIADLGHVSEKHALALEVAAGGRIKSIVVDDEHVAQKCIEYLKEHKLGVATFLPLNKVKGTSSSAPKATGVIASAIDLVEYDKKYHNAFSYVFGTTVVVEDLTSARKIGIGTHRMVTLSGDLVEISGAMSGGYLKRGKSGMGFQEKEVTDGLAKLETQLADLEALDAALQRKREENAKTIEDLRKAHATLEANIIKLERILKIDSGDTGDEKAEHKTLTADLRAAEKKLEAVQERVAGLAKTIANAKSKKHELRENLSQLRSPKLQAQLSAFDDERQKLENERVGVKTTLASLKAQKESVHERELENIERVFKQQGQESISFTKELDALVAKKKEQEQSLKEKEKEAQAFYRQFQKLFDERNKLQEDIAKVEQKTIEEEEKIRKIEQQQGSINIGLAGVRAELAGVLEESKQFEGVEPFKTKDLGDIEREIREFEKMMQALGAINMKALEIYETIEKEYADLLSKKETLGTEREQVTLMIAEIDLKKKDLFLKTFTIINDEFKQIFVKLNSKGDAFLELENPEDPLSAGMNIKVRLAGTKFLDIRSLSGGEKTMTALAFLFAIQENEPAQFYILDEVDAALDKRNAEKLATLIRQYSEKAQYIMISHNDVVINEADQLYGVSMNEHGESKVTSLRV